MNNLFYGKRFEVKLVRKQIVTMWKINKSLVYLLCCRYFPGLYYDDCTVIMELRICCRFPLI
jgi:hypothetical protein